VGIYPRRSGKQYITRASVAMSNTNEGICRWLYFAYGGCLRKDKKRSLNAKSCWRWIITGQIALSFLKDIYPYLRLKRLQAQIAIEFLEARRGSGYPSTDAELAVAEAQSVLMHKLNKVGSFTPAKSCKLKREGGGCFSPPP